MSGMREKLAWGLVAALGVAVLASFAGIVRGGPLDPTSGPSPTMKTLDEIPPAWGLSLDAVGGCDSIRFDCVLPGDVAVLDRETGLVWDKQPEADLDWATAVLTCRGVTIGGRKGWRLPTFTELQTLLDMTASPKLPVGHPFNGVLTLSTDFYWTANPALGGVSPGSAAWAMTFNSGNAQLKEKIESSGRHVWCVRAPEPIADPF